MDNRFRASFSIQRGTRLAKLKHGHINLAGSKLMELTLRALGLSLKRKVRLMWGDEMTVVYPEIASMGIARYGFFEEGLTRSILSSLAPGMTFLDIGAQLGYFTLLASWLVGEAGQVHSFEPIPRTFNLLKTNTEKNGNVQLNQTAVSSQSGTAFINDYGPRFSAFNSMYPARLPRHAKPIKTVSVEVPVISLDDYIIDNNLTPNFVKIDAEGSDFKILQGMEETLNKHKPLLSVEVGDLGVAGVPPSKEIVSHLTNKGYRAYEYLDSNFVKHEPREEYDHGDLFFRPST